MVKHLLIKKEKGDLMQEVQSVEVGSVGIEQNILCLPLRQVLLLPIQTLLDFNLKPGDLRENIIIEGVNLHTLESGTVLKIGDVEIRLTFHCEPCKVIKDKVNIREILHKRGVLGSFLNCGSINVGDTVTVGEKIFESIPYKIADRIKWYLAKNPSPVFVSKLVYDIGLSPSYCRAVPNIIRNRGDINKKLILYKGSNTS